MSEVCRLLAFTLDGQRYGLPLERVERVVRLVEITPLPGAPEVVLGVIDVQGHVIPAVSLRRRFGWPEAEPDPGEQLIIARSARRSVALRVEGVTGFEDCAAHQIVPAAEGVAGAAHIAGIATLPDGLVLIEDLDKFLSLEEARALEEVLDAVRT